MLYCVNGLEHREHGPAEIVWYTGSLGPWEASASFMIDGRIHNVRGPAKIFWRKDGQAPTETWWEDGSRWSTGGGPKAKEYQERRRKHIAVFVFAILHAKPVQPFPIDMARLIANEIELP